MSPPVYVSMSDALYVNMHDVSRSLRATTAVILPRAMDYAAMGVAEVTPLARRKGALLSDRLRPQILCRSGLLGSWSQTSVLIS